jgi:hypothetical protein
MISLEKRFIYIHIPKTGGNSIQNIIGKYSQGRIVSKKNHQDGDERFEIINEKHKTHKHSPLFEYRQNVDKQIYRQLFKFATIRNPWERAVSYYFSPHRGVNSFDKTKFVKLINKIRPAEYYLEDNYFIGFVNKVTDLNISLRNVKRNVDYIMKLENLDEDFKKICKEINIEYQTLPRKNSSSRKHYSYYYDNQTKRLVEYKFKKEIELGNYIFVDK